MRRARVGLALAVLGVLAAVATVGGATIIAGTTAPTDAPGTWTRTYDAGPGDEALFGGTRANDGYLLVGTTGREAGKEGRDAWVVRTDAAGDVTWQRTLHRADDDRFADVVAVPTSGEAAGTDGGNDDETAVRADDRTAYVVGGAWQASGGYYGGWWWVVGYDASGAVTWQRRGPYGGVYATTRAHDGNVLAVGGGGYVEKFAPDGTVHWSRSYNDTEFTDVVRVDGGYVLVGYDPLGGRTDGRLVHIRGDGEVVWNRPLHAPDDNSLWSLAAVPDGYVAGGQVAVSNSEHDPAWVVSFDRRGEYGWTRTVRGVDRDSRAMGAAPGPDGGTVLAGFQGEGDGFAVRVDASGATVSERALDHALWNAVALGNGSYLFLGSGDDGAVAAVAPADDLQRLGPEPTGGWADETAVEDSDVGEANGAGGSSGGTGGGAGDGSPVPSFSLPRFPLEAATVVLVAAAAVAVVAAVGVTVLAWRNL